MRKSTYRRMVNCALRDCCHCERNKPLALSGVEGEAIRRRWIAAANGAGLATTGTHTRRYGAQGARQCLFAVQTQNMSENWGVPGKFFLTQARVIW